MSPRHNRRRDKPPPLNLATVRSGTERTETAFDGVWKVRTITGAGAAKTYRCPGCNQEIPSSMPHLVAWPANETDGAQYRRHWHSACWRQRQHRR